MTAESKGQNPDEPLVSVCIPVRNRVKLVRRALESVLTQDLQDLEVLVVDNCSSDGTWESLQTFQHPRLRLVRNPRDLGMFGNFTRCIELARGRYMRILCSDDRLLPGSLRREVALMEANPSIVLLSSPGELVDEQARPVRYYGYGRHFPPGIYIRDEAVAAVLWVLAHYGYNPLNLCSGLLLLRAAGVRAGIFDAAFAGAADLDFWLRMLAAGNLGVINETSCEILIHPESGSSKLFSGGDAMLDQFRLAAKFSPLLSARGLYRRVLAQLSGRALWYAWRAIWAGEIRSAGIYWRMPVRYGVSLPLALAALGRHVLLRLRLRLWGTRRTLAQPISALVRPS